MEQLQKIFDDIKADPDNRAFTEKGILPLYHVIPEAEILIISQAPSRKAQESMVFWDDPSGDRLREWMGVTKDEFYNAGKVAVMPLDFYYPGKGTHGDLPPRKGFAEKWHAQLLRQMPNVKVTLLIGQYAQKYYLNGRLGKNLTETVRNYQMYLPEYFPLVHPSPLNYGWLKRNPWFETDVLPELQKRIRSVF
ncbi:uracil-DNA glycosylase [Lentilactobacillus curieae]|uniref:Uracil-DNA glycosylase n=1 Tax=Lentilactobacillus curieae TaxID=1138822 RepID=A0A1S6QHQ9_9LACO|nr:uracil-DNA glycosylase family protein [Lentilactobacillus curieae]AQW21142.1 uracil-DNA glycosylase [Lentilactobacillus curieae]